MHNRREFLKRVGLVSGAASLATVLPWAIERAFAIDPEPGSSYLDAEHVVILMQENRSFDHAFGCLRGVRGFNDPRAIKHSDGSPVWVQTNDAGETYVPFRLNIKESRATWMGSLPHSWTDQVDARNSGKHDRWLQAKRSSHHDFAKMPLTMGYYNREDLPFYYALADAFTICDQHFCSSLTGTTPNRLHLWTGTIRANQSTDSPANVLNSDVDLESRASWPTFPERLEKHGISWKVYQNELSVPTGFVDEQASWLSNFDDNPLEYFTQYHVQFSAAHRRYLDQLSQSLPTEIAVLEKQVAANSGVAEDAASATKQLAEKRAMLRRVKIERERWNQAEFDKLSNKEKNLHAKAFCVNDGDPHYRELEALTYDDNGTKRTLNVPKGDVLHQFRQDVNNGKLPVVSWIVAPEAYSDHPSSAWFGAWYIAEILDILTKNPDVWKKSIFLLTYDENDGYFDHIPPFCAPDPRDPQTGKVSPGIDAGLEFVTLEQELQRKPRKHARENSIGLGYRVPLIIASPWSRGGCVCSQVFDHTSSLQFLEKLLSHKFGTTIREDNINQWRRTVCGDLTSAFQPFSGNSQLPPFPLRDAFVEEIHKAKFKGLPSNYKALTIAEIGEIRRDPLSTLLLPRQEPGTRRSTPLPYDLAVDETLSVDRRRFEIQFEACNKKFGHASAGAPFVVYALNDKSGVSTRNYAVSAGDRLMDSWSLDDFQGGQYHLIVYGPNGFFREFQGSSEDPPLKIRVTHGRADAAKSAINCSIAIQIDNNSEQDYAINVSDRSYGGPDQTSKLRPRMASTLVIDEHANYGWHDLEIRVEGVDTFRARYAARVESGQWTYSDPSIGRTK